MSAETAARRRGPLFTADRWPRPLAASSQLSPVRGTLLVLGQELAKIARLRRVHLVLATCLLAPFAFDVALRLQSALPTDTLFGQWLHDSGFALPLVLLVFAGQWLLPLLVAVVAGDIFACEDQHRTWTMVLTRGRSRGELFLGKALAALAYSASVLVVLTAAAMVAGQLRGAQPLVGLSGQLVAPGSARTLVLVSWASQLAPVLAFCALSVLLSVLSRSTVVGVGGPVALGLLMQLSSLVVLPAAVRTALITTPFGAWRGLWLLPADQGPLRTGAASSAVWVLACLAVAWLAFRRRTVSAS